VPVIFNSLEESCRAFAISIESVHKRNQYIPKIRDYLIPYLRNNKPIENSQSEIEKLFKYNITLQDLIDSTIYYVKNNANVNSETGINDFIIAFNQFFRFLYENNIENTNLVRLWSTEEITELKKQIIERLQKEGIRLNPPQQDPPITEEEFSFILSYCEKINHNDNFKRYESSIIIKLFIFLGLKAEKMYNIKNNHFNNETGILEIESKDGENYYVQLPYNLTKQLKILMKLKEERFPHISDFLFVNNRGKKVDNSFLTELLNEIRDEFNKNRNTDLLTLELERNRFTQTGLIKYAVIEMIKKGINQSIIQDFTGNGENIYNDCQKFVNESKQGEKNRYLNSKLRSIETYDLM
jgi:site-specific recombinase XerD